MLGPDNGQLRCNGKTYSHIVIDRTPHSYHYFPWIARRLAELDPKTTRRNGRTRLMVADRHIPMTRGEVVEVAGHRIPMSFSDDILPGQICVGLETAGIGAGRMYDGIHIVRYWDSEEQRTVERVARVDVIGSCLKWADRDQYVPRGEIKIVANVVGVYMNDNRDALRMFAN